jgi:hypothetical protein
MGKAFAVLLIGCVVCLIGAINIWLGILVMFPAYEFTTSLLRD